VVVAFVVVAVVETDDELFCGGAEAGDVEAPEFISERVRGPKYPVAGSPWAD
jgi:hypothetical protein